MSQLFSVWTISTLKPNLLTKLGFSPYEWYLGCSSTSLMELAFIDELLSWSSSTYLTRRPSSIESLSSFQNESSFLDSYDLANCTFREAT